MNQFSKYLSLPAEEKRLIFNIFRLLLIYWVKLKISSISSIFSKAYNQSCPDSSAQSTSIRLKTIIRIINSVSHFVPSTCLSKSLVGQILLTKNGYKSQIHIGVRKTNGERLDAHAWLTVDGKIIIGNLEDIASFRELRLHQLSDVL